MQIKRIGFNKPSTIVLGAGATRGAEFVQATSLILPPLDADFFTQAQRLSSKKPKELLEKLIEHTVSIFGKNFSLTMEGFLTHIEHLSNVFQDYKLQGRPGTNPFPEIRDIFLQLLAAVMDESIGRNPECRYHKTLVESITPKDTILSFNYDWLIDHILKTHARNKWNPKIGYGINVYVGGKKGRGTEYWACEDPKTRQKTYPSSSISLLKMHGALNWFPVPKERKPLRLQLRERWWHQQGKLKFEIAPPEWNKPIRSGIYQHIWRRARKELRKTKAVLLIGYSMPETDLPARALFTVDAINHDDAVPLELLIIVNPDRKARERIRRILLGRINNKTRILTFDLLQEFSSFLSAQ